MPLRAAVFLIAAILLAPAAGHAQAPPDTTTLPPGAPGASLKGRFQDATSRAAVPGVQVKLTNLADTSKVHRATAKDDGSFEIAGLTANSHRLEATRLGYAPLRMILRVTRRNQDAGVLALTPESVPVSGVEVSESPPPATVKGDTTEFRAGAVKVHRDATAEDLVQKLPGVTMEGGQVKAQGETVQNVLVNGRPFFGSDPTAAMRNLPAEVVDRIQVYDRMSDQAEFSGFDDGRSQKTMNFILRDTKLNFGKAYAGYGDQDRYQAGGNATMIRGATRLTAIGMSNNINQRNFSIQDLFGGMSGVPGGGPRRVMMGGGGGFRPGGGGGGPQIIRMGGGSSSFDPSSFLIGQQPGIATTHSGGLNYSGQWGKDLEVTSSLFVNDTDNENFQTLSRQYLPPQDSLAYYDESTTADSRNRNQRFDARFEWIPDSVNSVIVQPRFYLQQSEAASIGSASNTTDEGSMLGTATSRNVEGVDGDNLSTRMTLRHRFARPGRTVSAEINAGRNLREADGAQRSLTDYFDNGSTTSDTLDVISDARTVTNTFSTRVAFTERLTPGLRAQLIYHPSITRSEADARAFGLDGASGEYVLPDSALSNSYRSRYTTQTGGLALLHTRGPWRLLGNASYQHTRLESEQMFPASHTLSRTFGDFVPSLTFSGTFANRRNVRLAWNTSVREPSVGQLQNVVNSSNPLSLTTGNPDLRPTYTHSLSLRVSEADPAHSRSKFLFLNASRTSHPIGNSTFTAPSDTTVDGIFLARGTQLTRPVNLDESWNANLFGVYSRPAAFLKSIVSLHGGGTFTRTPSRVGGLDNLATNYTLRSGVTVSSNISQNLDFTLSYFGTQNFTRSTLNTTNSGDYYSHVAGLRFNAVARYGIVVRQELNHNLQSGVPSAYGQDVVLWNTTLGKKFLKDQRGELRVTATDVMRQNRSVNRSITETYVQDSRDQTLGRYVQAVFTYSFGGAPGEAAPRGPRMPRFGR